MLSALTVVDRATQSLVSTALLRKHGRIDSSFDDELLAIYLPAAVQLAETFLSRALLTQTLRWVVMETQAPPVTGMVLPGLSMYPGSWLGLPHALQRPLILPRSPVQSVLQVALGDPEGGPDQVLEPTSWVADTETEPGRLRLHEHCFGRAMRHVAVNFVAGYGDDPSDVPAPIRVAVMMTAVWLYEQRGDGDATMPDVAERLLWPYRMVQFGS